MPRLPKPGGDNGNWGDILNEYLSVSLSGDGSLKPDVITKGSLGLGNVDNTSDANKPVSQAMQSALDQKITGPEAATEHALARFDGTSGKLLKVSSVTVDDSGKLSMSPATGHTFILQANANAQWTNYSNSFSARGQFRAERYRGSEDDPQAVVANDYVLSLAGRAYDGGAVQQSAGVDIYVDGTPVSGESVPMRIAFTTGTNAGNRAERLMIRSDGKIGIGTDYLPAKLTINSTAYGNNQSGGLSLTAVNNGIARWEMYYRLNSDSNGGPRQALGFVNRDAAGNITYNSEHLSIQYDGKVGINTIAPTHTVTLPSSSNGIAIYNTTDQTTNFERLRLYWSANTAVLSTELGGTGLGRSLRIGTHNRSFTVNDAPSYSTGVYQYLQGTGIAGYSMLLHGTKTHSSGFWSELAIKPTINQSGSAAYTALLINPSENTTGTGERLLIDLQVGDTSRFKVASNGLVTAAGRIANVTDPTSGQDAATKSYVDIQTTAAADAAPYSSVTWSGTVTLTPNVAHTYNVSITANTTLTLNAPSATKSFMITCVIQQDATGSRTLTFNGTKWPYGSPPSLSTAANATDVLHFFWTGTQWLGVTGGLSYA